jgi:hypothetical protein
VKSTTVHDSDFVQQNTANTKTNTAKANVVADALSRKYCEDETDPKKLMGQLSQ